MRNCTYIAADFDHDENAVKHLHWMKSQGLINFLDAHELQQSNDSSLACSIKKSLKYRMDNSYKFVEDHYAFTSGIDENRFEDRAHKLAGTTYHLKGQNVASTYQFWVTDSVSHFLRGAMYIDCTPNNDSLSPVLTYIREDIDHMIETIRWR